MSRKRVQYSNQTSQQSFTNKSPGPYYLTDAEIAHLQDISKASNGKTYARIRSNALPGIKGQSAINVAGGSFVPSPNDYIYLTKENNRWRTANKSMLSDITSLWPTQQSNPDSDRIQDDINGDGSSTWTAASAYDPNSALVKPHIESQARWDIARMRNAANPLANGWDNSWNALDFMNTVLPLKQLSPTFIAGAMMQDKEGFWRNYLWGDNRGLAEFNQTTRDWADAHPYLNAGLNIIGDAATFKFLPRIPRLMPKFRGSIGNIGNTALESLGKWSNAGEQFASRVTSSAWDATKNAVKGAPGGSYAAQAGRYATQAGNTVGRYANRAVNAVKNYGNKAVQSIVPENVRTTISDAWDVTSPYLKYFNPSNAIGKGFELATGQTLTPLAKTGLSAGYTAGSTAWDLTNDYLNGKDVDVTKAGNFLKYVPVVKSFDKLYSWYNKGNSLFNNVEDMVKNGVNTDNIYDAGNNIATMLSNNNDNNDKEEEIKIELPSIIKNTQL